jgi:hypothetical protein
MGKKTIINSKIMLIIGLILIISGVLLYPILNSGNKSNTEEKEEKKTQRVGNEEYGYITIPDDWHELNNEEGLSYQGTINNYVVTVNKHSEVTAMSLKEDFLKEQLDKNAVNVRVDYLDSGDIQIDSFPDNANSWSSVMIYEMQDEQAITVEIDGPVKDEEYLQILKTYSTTK